MTITEFLDKWVGREHFETARKELQLAIDARERRPEAFTSSSPVFPSPGERPELQLAIDARERQPEGIIGPLAGFDSTPKQLVARIVHNLIVGMPGIEVAGMVSRVDVNLLEAAAVDALEDWWIDPTTHPMVWGMAQMLVEEVSETARRTLEARDE